MQQLRELGEKLCSAYPGAADMGMHQHHRRVCGDQILVQVDTAGYKETKCEYMLESPMQVHQQWRRTDWSRVQQSCETRDITAKRVLVTGTGGFVGMYAAMALRMRGDGVCWGGG